MTLPIVVSPYGVTREEVEKVAQHIVDSGLDGVSVGDGMIGTSSFPVWTGGTDSFVQIGWLAGRYDLPMYGIEALMMPARDPRIVAKQASSLAAVTGGRFHLAVANGRWRHDAELFGYDFDQRGARLDEGIRALQAIWRGDQEFHGRFWSWSVDAGHITPTQAFAPPPLWIGGEGPVTIKRAIKYGLAWLPTRFVPADLAPLAGEYFDQGGVGLKVRMRMSVVQPPAVPEDKLAYPKLIGPPAFLAEQVHAYQQLGADYLSIVAGFDFASSMATIDALADAKRQLT